MAAPNTKIPLKLKATQPKIQLEPKETPKLLDKAPKKGPAYLSKSAPVHKVYTQHTKSVLPKETATAIYQCLKTEIKWKESIFSHQNKQLTRLSKAVSVDDHPMVKYAVTEAIKSLKLGSYIIYGIYLNYYRDGNDYTPSHSHAGTTQLIISLNEDGGDRILKVGKTDYFLQNGDCIIFGASQHGVPKEDTIPKKGRISIALFMKHAPELNGLIAYVA